MCANMRHMTQWISPSCSCWHSGTSIKNKPKLLLCLRTLLMAEDDNYLLKDYFVSHLLILQVSLLAASLLSFYFLEFSVMPSITLFFFYSRGLVSGCEKIISIIQVLFIPVRKESSCSGQTMARYVHCSYLCSPFYHSVEKKQFCLPGRT